MTILEDHYGGRPGWVILLRDIHPIVAAGVREDRTDVLKVSDVPLRDAGLALRIEAMLVGEDRCHRLTPCTPITGARWSAYTIWINMTRKKHPASARDSMAGDYPCGIGSVIRFLTVVIVISVKVAVTVVPGGGNMETIKPVGFVLSKTAFTTRLSVPPRSSTSAMVCQLGMVKRSVGGGGTTTTTPPVCAGRFSGKAVNLKSGIPRISLINVSGSRASLILLMAKDAASAMTSRSPASAACTAGRSGPSGGSTISNSCM